MNFLRSLWRGPPSGAAQDGASGSGSAAATSPASGTASARAMRRAKQASSSPLLSSVARSRSSTSTHALSSSSPSSDPEAHRRALALRTPHSGYHFDGSGRRFFEGWYFKVTLPGEAQAFALIYSIEDPKKSSTNDEKCSSSPSSSSSSSSSNSSTPGLGVQIMGPDDSYLIQYDSDVSKFWAKDPELALGACFEAKKEGGGEGTNEETPLSGPVSPTEFDERVGLGFQATATWHQGSVVAREEGASGSLVSTVKRARWAFKVEPVLGW